MKIKVHKHRGQRWTVTAYDSGQDTFDWLIDNYGEEDFEHFPWTRIWDTSDYIKYEFFDKKLLTMFLLRWA